MFRHIVLLGFKQPLSQQDHDDIERSCAAIKHGLTGIIDLRFVVNLSDRALSYTHAFVADFVDQAAHDRYQQAPVHAQLKQKVGGLCDQLAVLDYQA